MPSSEINVERPPASENDRGISAPARSNKVAYLLQVFPKYSETFILNELLEHQRRQAPVRVLSLRFPREGRFHGCLTQLEQPVEYVPESFWDKPGKIAESLPELLRSECKGLLAATGHRVRRRVTFRDLWQAIVVRRWAQRRGIAHLHCHFGGYAATVAYLSHLMGGPAYSVTLHAFDIFRETVHQELLRRIISRSAFCVTVSRFNAAHLQDRILADPLKIRVLYNGIPLDRFEFSDAPREAGTILSVGRLIEKKGFVHLIRACQVLKEQGRRIRCDIVGDGPLKDELNGEIKTLGLRDEVRLVGAWSQERVAEALKRSAVFALPCVEAKDGNMDALPTVLLEAMAAGCPCVSTRLSGIPEIVEDNQTGLLVAPGDAAALASAVAQLLSSPDQATRFAMAARARAERLFDVRRNVSTLAQWLHGAARGESQSPSRLNCDDLAPAVSASAVRGEVAA